MPCPPAADGTAIGRSQRSSPSSLRRWRWLGRPRKAGTSRRNARGWQPTGDRSTAGARRSYVVRTRVLVTPFFTPSGHILPDDPFGTITSVMWYIDGGPYGPLNA